MEEHLKYHKINLDASHIFDLQAGHNSKMAAREYTVGMDDHCEVTRDMKKVEDSGSVAQGCGFVIEERSRS